MLPVVNVWLALAFDSHVHHPSAKAWFDGLPTSAVSYFCRVTQAGFLRLATNPSVFGPDAVTLPDAWRLYDLFLSDPRVTFADEPALLESHWRALTQSDTYSPQVWSDAYLAAFVIAGGLELVTFDRALAQLQNVKAHVLH